jgi:phage tail sheath protein FI
MLLSDVTSSLDPAWRGGGVSRLMATLLRTARRVGEAEMFEANGEDLWLRVRRSLETLLDDWWRAGALGGANPAEAYEVRCGRDTMSQNDLDNGRVRVEVSILPAAAVERITVVFDLAAAGSTGVMRGVA